MRKTLFLLFVLGCLLFVPCSASAQYRNTGNYVTVRLTPDRADWTYRCKSDVRLELQVIRHNVAIPNVTVGYTWGYEQRPALTKDSLRIDKTGKKVFTAIGSEYPSDQSPFTYRKVFKNNNTYFVIAEKGDTYAKIAQDIQVMVDNLRKFNDASPDDEPVENEIVYVEAKARGSAMRIHTVQAGETLRYISQRYGVQLRYILKYNMLEENSVIHPGDQILLRR